MSENISVLKFPVVVNISVTINAMDFEHALEFEEIDDDEANIIAYAVLEKLSNEGSDAFNTFTYEENSD